MSYRQDTPQYGLIVAAGAFIVLAGQIEIDIIVIQTARAAAAGSDENHAGQNDTHKDLVENPHCVLHSLLLQNQLVLPQLGKARTECNSGRLCPS
jgi:hypothetical protein